MKNVLFTLALLISFNSLGQEYLSMNKKELRIEYQNKLNELSDVYSKLKILENAELKLKEELNFKIELLLNSKTDIDQLNIKILEINNDLDSLKFKIQPLKNNINELSLKNDSLSNVIIDLNNEIILFKDTISSYINSETKKNKNRIPVETYWQRETSSGFAGIILSPSMIYLCADGDGMAFVNGAFIEEALVSLEKEDNKTYVFLDGWDENRGEYRKIEFLEISILGQKVKVKDNVNNDTYYYKSVSKPPCEYLLF